MSKSLDELLPERPDARRHIYAYAIDDTAHASLLKVGPAHPDDRRNNEG